jgi:hypothetical protein
MSASIRRSLHWIGSVLALLGVVFVAFKLHSYWVDLDISRINLDGWCLIVLFALIYGSANLLLSLAWWYLLRHLGASITCAGTIKVYGISQLAKYLPGNIFHLAGRQALGMSAGLSASVLAKSTIWELGALAIAGSLFGWLILPLTLTGISEVASVLLLLSSAILIAVLLRKIVGNLPIWSFVCQLLFLAISGMVFVALLDLIAEGEGLILRHFLMISGAYILAWLIGLVTPGAPAGVGVREMILLLLLKGLITEMDLLTAILLGRLVTVAGDLIFFVAASLIPNKFCPLEKSNV